MRAALALLASVIAVDALRFYPAHRDVDIEATLLGGSQEASPVRSPMYVLAGFVNNGDDALNVTNLIGWVTEGPRVVANLSSTRVNQLVEPGGEVSLEFPWELAADLPSYPYPLRLAVVAYYHDDRTPSKRFSQRVFNDTLLFVAAPSAHGAAAFVPLLLNLGTWALVIAAFAFLPAAAPSVAAAFKGIAAVPILARPPPAYVTGVGRPAYVSPTSPAAAKPEDDSDFGDLSIRKGGVKQRK